ncbi:MAG: hypothetical protein K9M54_12000, partial [Kiritimatiellales bacterium]|nr:hypothetical protein [Kiritimatiellales bacterium]
MLINPHNSSPYINISEKYIAKENCQAVYSRQFGNGKGAESMAGQIEYDTEMYNFSVLRDLRKRDNMT